MALRRNGFSASFQDSDLLLANRKFLAGLIELGGLLQLLIDALRNPASSMNESLWRQNDGMQNR